MRNPFKRSKAVTGGVDVAAALQNGGSAFPRGGGQAPFQLGAAARQRILDAYTTAQDASFAWIYANSPAVRTVIDVLTTNMGQLDLRLYEEISESERQPRPDHPAALSLRYPNETTTSDSWLRSFVKDFLIHDNAITVLLPASGSQLTLIWLPAHKFEYLGSNMLTVEKYRFWRPEGWGYQDFTPDQIMHWKGENPEDPRIGVSRLQTLRDVIAEDVAYQAATVELAKSGLQEPVWVGRPLDAPEISNQALELMEEDLRNRMRQRNSKPIVLAEGMEFHSFGVTPRDAEMMDIRRFAISQIANLYGVPLGMVGLADDVAAARSQFVTDTLPPLCEQFTRFLNQRILVRVYNWTDGCFELDLDEKRMSDDRLKALTSASGRAVMTSNEARARLNLKPVDTGDELVTPLNVIVGDNPKPSPQVMPPQQPGAPPQDGSGRQQDQMPDGQPPKALVKAEPLPQLHPRRSAEMERQRRNVEIFQTVVQRHFTRLSRSLNSKMMLLERNGQDPDRVLTKADWRRWDREFGNDILRNLKRVVDHEGGIYMLKLAAPNEFDMAMTEHYLEAMAESAAGAINDTIRHEIEAVGFEEAMNRASQHVASAGTSLGARSTMWAREEAARQAPGFQNRVKSWIADTQRHAEFDGDTVPVGEDWPAGFAPGSAPACACSMAIT